MEIFTSVVFATEDELLAFARELGAKLTRPACFLLIGDVGAGKTTFTRGLAEGLGVKEPVTSPSFTISKRYAIPRSGGDGGGELVHYDFYRLDDPGIMCDDLAEVLEAPESVTVIEWGDDVRDLLPDSAIRLDFMVNDDGSRTVTRVGAGEMRGEEQ